MDKMIKDGRGEILITNDGATILQKLDVVHPTAKMVLLSRFSLSKFPRPKMSKLVTEPPQLLSLLELSSKQLRVFWIVESIPTSSLKVHKFSQRFPKSP